MSLLALFMVVGGAKFAVQSCIEPAENSKKLKKKMVGNQNLPTGCHSQPSNWEGKKKEGKSQSWLPDCLPYLHEHIYLLFWPKKMRGVSP